MPSAQWNPGQAPYTEANSEALRQAVGDLSLGLHKGAAQDLDALTGVLEEARAALADVCNVKREASRESSSQLVLAGESLTAQLDRTFREADLAISPLTAQMAEFGTIAGCCANSSAASRRRSRVSSIA